MLIKLYQLGSFDFSNHKFGLINGYLQNKTNLLLWSLLLYKSQEVIADTWHPAIPTGCRISL